MSRVGQILGLAATPTFAAMALLSALAGPSMTAVCGPSAGGGLGGMTAMYGLMAVFHAAPWLRRLGLEG